jgi:hypothetical protein
VKTKNSNDIDNLFDNNKEIIDKLMEEKRLLESIFLDNRTPKQFKKELLAPYNALSEMVSNRLDVNRVIMKSKEKLNIVGILYNENQQRYISSVIRNLQNVADRKKVSILLFTIDNVDLNNGLVTGTLISDSIVKEITIAIPQFIYNTGYYTKPSNRNKIKQLCMTYGSIVVNPINTFNQAVVFDILSSLPNSKDFILPFSRLTPSVLEEYLNFSNSIFLVPESGLIRSAAIRIEKSRNPEENHIIVYVGKNRHYFNGDNCFQDIKKMLGNKEYMVIQGRRSLMWNDSPLEGRVYIQKDISGKWNVTDIIAKNEIFFKDSMFKDTTDDLRKALLDSCPDEDEVEETIEHLANYSKNTCVYLDYYFSQLGSCTLDFIIDKRGMPYLIHFGGWDQKDYLFRLNDNNSWGKYISNSIDYLIFLKSEDERER